MINSTIELFNINDVNKHNEENIYYREKNTRCLGKQVEIGHRFNFERFEYWAIKPNNKVIPKDSVFTAKDAIALFENHAAEELEEVIRKIQKVAKDKRYLCLDKLSKAVHRDLMYRGFEVETSISTVTHDATYKIIW
jgi:hypothetical protein